MIYSDMSPEDMAKKKILKELISQLSKKLVSSPSEEEPSEPSEEDSKEMPEEEEAEEQPVTKISVETNPGEMEEEDDEESLLKKAPGKFALKKLFGK